MYVNLHKIYAICLVCLGIGIGIVYTMSEKLVLELELFNLRLKNWYELALELELFKQ